MSHVRPDEALQTEPDELLGEPNGLPSIIPPGQGGREVSSDENSAEVWHPYGKPRSDCTALPDDIPFHDGFLESLEFFRSEGSRFCFLLHVATAPSEDYGEVVDTSMHPWNGGVWKRTSMVRISRRGSSGDKGDEDDTPTNTNTPPTRAILCSCTP